MVSCCTEHRSVPLPYLRRTHGRQMTAAAAFYGTVMRLTVVSRIWEGEKLCFKKRFSGSVVFWCCRGGYVCDRLTVKMPNAKRYNRAASRSTMDKLLQRHRRGHRASEIAPHSRAASPSASSLVAWCLDCKAPRSSAPHQLSSLRCRGPPILAVSKLGSIIAQLL